MPINDDVPREFDKIQVQYLLNTGESVWWPATIIASREHDVPGTVKGTATVHFAAFRKFKECEEELQFLSNRMVTTSDGDTAWRTSTEAADAGDGDGDEADWGGDRNTTITTTPTAVTT